MVDYLAKQNISGALPGYNQPGLQPFEPALPGMKGIDLQSWRDLLTPRPGEPIPAAEGAIEMREAIRAMQYIPNVYAVQKRPR